MRARELLPWRELVIDTSWSPEEAHAALDGMCTTSARLGPLPGAPFAGEAKGPGAFELRGNPRLPSLIPVVLRVDVTPGRSRGARVRVVVRLHRFQAVLLLVGVTVMVAAWQLVGAALAVVAVGILTMTFRVQARVVERILREAFAAAPGLPEAPETGVPFR